MGLFHEEIIMRVIPVSEKETIRSIYEQLKNGTIFSTQSLHLNNKKTGPRINVRYGGYMGNSTVDNVLYKISNDERRRIMPILKSLIELEQVSPSEQLENVLSRG